MRASSSRRPWRTFPSSAGTPFSPSTCRQPFTASGPPCTGCAGGTGEGSSTWLGRTASSGRRSRSAPPSHSCAPRRRRRSAVPRCPWTAGGSHNDGASAGPRPMKTIALEQAAALIPDGTSVMIGGFMGVGTPERLIDELVRRGTGGLTVIANDTAMPGVGIGKLMRAGLVRRAVVSHIGLNPETQQQMIAGKTDVDLVPQGTLIERIRAGGCGLGGVLTETGVGTVVEKGKRTITLDGTT